MIYIVGIGGAIFALGYLLSDVIKEAHYNNEVRKDRNQDKNTIQKKHKK